MNTMEKDMPMARTALKHCLERPYARLDPYVREAGAGSAIVCLHANVSHSAQWRSLMMQLSTGRPCSGGRLFFH